MKTYAYNSTTGNENPFARSHTPCDDKPEYCCKSCYLEFNLDDLSKGGYCAGCCGNQIWFYTCANCSHEWDARGIVTRCPNCKKEYITTDERFVDDLIAEKQRAEHVARIRSHKTFAIIVVLATLLLSWNLNGQSKPQQPTPIKTDTTVSRIALIERLTKQAEQFKAWAEAQLQRQNATIEGYQNLKNDSLTVDKSMFR